MSVTPASRIEIEDEGVLQGRVRRINFTGNALTASVTADEATVNGVAGSGSFIVTTVEKDLGTIPLLSGSFSITGLSGLTSGANILIQQAAGPYTGKGDLDDESEMDAVNVNAKASSATTILAFWNSVSFVKGNFKFSYAV